MKSLAVGIEELKATGKCLSDPKTLSYFAKDLSYHHPTIPLTVFIPENEKDVQRGLIICNHNGIKVTCTAGKTSLEGASIPGEETVVFDMSMVELNDILKKDNLTLSNDPGMGACLGGMVGTNCSGTLAYRYGTIKDNVISLRVILPTGQIITTRRRPPKSSAGYDLTRLFIGSEGTLAITTQITLKLRVIQEEKGVILVRFKDVEGAGRAAMDLVTSGIILNRIEFMDEVCVKAVNIANEKEYEELPTLIVEVVGDTQKQVALSVQNVKEICIKAGGLHLNTGTDELWGLRKSAFFAVQRLRKRKSKVLTTDCAVPISRLTDLLKETRKELTRLNLVGSIVAHAGDGNLHALVLVDPDDEDEVKRAEEFRRINAEFAISLDGTCTGEHGIGIGKRELLVKELGEDAVDVMRRIKQILDPNGIMNPGKIFEMESKVTSSLRKAKL